MPNMRGILVREHYGSIFVIDGGYFYKEIVLRNDKILSLNGKKCSSMKEYRKHKDYFLIGPIKLRITRAKSEIQSVELIQKERERERERESEKHTQICIYIYMYI